MLELARLAVKRKEAFTHVKPKPDEGAGVGVESGRSSKVGPMAVTTAARPRWSRASRWRRLASPDAVSGSPCQAARANRLTTMMTTTLAMAPEWVGAAT